MKNKKEKKAPSNTPSSGKRTKYILLGLGLVAFAAGAYYFISKIKTANNSILPDSILNPENQSDLTDIPVPERTSSSNTGSSSNTSQGKFPLKRGSRGELVKRIQNLLIKKYGQSVLPKYGADGHWGSELESVMLAKGFPNVISETQFKEWSAAGVIPLSGFGKILCDQIRAVLPVRVWNAKGDAIQVPRGTILGEFLGAKNGVTNFKTLDGKILYTNTHCIGYV